MYMYTHVHVHVHVCVYLLCVYVRVCVSFPHLSYHTASFSDRKEHTVIHMCKTALHVHVHQVHRALFRKEGEGKEREITTTSTA